MSLNRQGIPEKIIWSYKNPSQIFTRCLKPSLFCPLNPWDATELFIAEHTERASVFGRVWVCTYIILPWILCEQAHPMLWQLQGSGQEWLPLSSETHRWRKLFTVFFLMGFHGWLTFKLNSFASYFAYSCYSTFLSLLDPASPWIFDAKLKHCKPRDKFYPGCSPRRA